MVFQPRHLLFDVGRWLRPSMPPSIAFSSEIPSDLWLLRGDPFQTYRGLLALCRAASSQLPGGKLVLGARNRRIDDVAAALRPGLPAGPYLVVEVASSGGRGVFSDEATALFAAIGAFPEITAAGDGQVLCLYLAALPPAPTASPAERRRLVAGHGELVLVVEGDAAVREALGNTLEQHSYRPPCRRRWGRGGRPLRPQEPGGGRRRNGPGVSRRSPASSGPPGDCGRECR